MISTDLRGRFEQLRAQHGLKCANGSASFRSVDSALEVVLRCETDAKRMEISEKVAIKYFQTNNPGVCNELHPETLAIFKELREWIKYFKYGFIELTSGTKIYQKFDNSNIMDHLIAIQNQIETHNIFQGYRKALMSLRNQFSWPEQFVNQWIQQSQYMKENQIELFRPKERPQQTHSASKKSFKRAAPSSSNSKAEVQTQIGEEPIKKVKKDSVNYRAIVLSIERILEITNQDKRQILKQRFNEFKQTENLQYLQLLDQESAKRIFEMRSYIKLFLDATNEATMSQKYSHLADKDLLEKIFSFQSQVDPDNVFESYKDFLEANYSQLGWPIEMIHGVLRRVVEFKRMETEYLLKR